MIVSKIKLRDKLTLICFYSGITVTFAPTSYTVSESDEYVVVVVRMVGGNSEVDLPVIFSTVDDTAVGTISKFI